MTTDRTTATSRVASPRADSRPGRVVAGRYRLDAFLGKGAMGEVWRATHLGLGSPIALKLIDPMLIAGSERSTREELVARFEREARAAAALQSNHVVKVTDHGTDEHGTPYMAMELLEGESLADRIHRQGGLSPTATLSVLTQVGRAMSRAHQLGIVHRDLKPENVFLATADGEETAKVLDFGIAKLTRSPLDIAPHSTSAGQVMGTPCYMSPEQASGAPTVDHRSDLWAMAVMAYECLTGQLPFLSQNFGELVLAICTGPLPVPSQVAPGMPASFDRWWARAAARRPDERFQSATELVEALRDALEGRSTLVSAAPLPRTEISTPPVATPFERTIASARSGTQRLPQRRGIRRELVGAFFAAALAAVGFLAFRIARPTNGPTTTPPAQAESPPAPLAAASETTPASAPAATVTPGDVPVPSASVVEPAPSATSARTVAASRPRPSASTAPTTPPPPTPPPHPTIDPRLGL